MNATDQTSPVVMLELYELAGNVNAGKGLHARGPVSDQVRLLIRSVSSRFHGTEQAGTWVFPSHDSAISFISALREQLDKSSPPGELLPIANGTTSSEVVDGTILRYGVWFEWPADTERRPTRRVGPRVVPIEARTSRPVPRTQTNIQDSMPAFFGRQEELDQLSLLLVSGDARVVTLHGAGGTGKTRLAIQFGLGARKKFPGGVWLAQGADTSSLEGVCQAVAKAVGASVTGAHPIKQAGWALQSFTAHCGAPLIIFDNAEQVAGPLAVAIGEWLDVALEVRWLVTSRERLGLKQERLLALEPLPVPGPKGQGGWDESRLREFQCVNLFIDRAQRGSPSFLPDLSSIQAVAGICRRLDGIPLAIELAASRIRYTTPAELLQQLESQGSLQLSDSRRTPTARQATLNGAIAWSWRLLSTEERNAALVLSHFPAGFGGEIVERLLGSGSEGVLEALWSKSIIHRVPVPKGLPIRYSMFESIREFARERIHDERGDREEPTRARQCMVELLEICEQLVEKAWGENTNYCLDLLGLEVENLFYLQTLVGEQEKHLAARAALAADHYLALRRSGPESIERLSAALKLLGIDPDRGRFPASRMDSLAVSLTTALARAHHASGSAAGLDAASLVAVEAARKLRERSGSPESAVALARALRVRELHHRRLGEYEQCHRILTEAVALARTAGDVRMAAVLTGLRGEVHRRRAEYGRAMACFASAEESARAAGDLVTTSVALGNRGVVHWSRGEFSAALGFMAEAERIAESIGDDRTLRLNIGNRGLVHLSRGDWEHALECFIAAAELDRAAGSLGGYSRNIGNRGLVLLGKGEFSAAMLLFVEAENICKRIGATGEVSNWTGCRGVAHYCLGELTAALECLKIAESNDRRVGNLHQLHHWLIAHASIRMRQHILEPDSGAVQLGRALAAAGEARRILIDLRLIDTVEYFRTLALLARVCWELAGHPQEQQWVSSAVLVGNLPREAGRSDIRVLAKNLASEAIALSEDLSVELTHPLSANHPDLQVRDAFQLLAPILSE